MKSNTAIQKIENIGKHKEEIGKTMQNKENNKKPFKIVKKFKTLRKYNKNMKNN